MLARSDLRSPLGSIENPRRRIHTPTFLPNGWRIHGGWHWTNRAAYEERGPDADYLRDNDPSFPVVLWYPMIGRIPRGQIIVLPQAGHGPQHQYPDLTAEYIDGFLRQQW